MNDKRIAEIKKRYQVATAQPWARRQRSVITDAPVRELAKERIFYDANNRIAGHYAGICAGALVDLPYWQQELDDLDFIAHAREDVPALIEDLEVAYTALNELKRWNRLNNDLDSYLMRIAEWGLDEGAKPDPVNYGVDNGN